MSGDHIIIAMRGNVDHLGIHSLLKRSHLSLSLSLSFFLCHCLCQCDLNFVLSDRCAYFGFPWDLSGQLGQGTDVHPRGTVDGRHAILVPLLSVPARKKIAVSWMRSSDQTLGPVYGDSWHELAWTGRCCKEG